jgi:glutathione S-transferase
MRHFGIAFDEIVIPMAQENTRAEMLHFSPTGKCPSLHDGKIVSPNSIHVCQSGRGRGAQARSIAAEMHSGFIGMRGLLPMNMRRKVKQRALAPEASAGHPPRTGFWASPQGVRSSWRLLFGDFSAADAMFAPVVNRLHLYNVAVKPGTRAYMDAMMALPAWQDRSARAQAETWIIDKYEIA